jgi:hypothetical protein
MDFFKLVPSFAVFVRYLRKYTNFLTNVKTSFQNFCNCNRVGGNSSSVSGHRLDNLGDIKMQPTQNQPVNSTKPATSAQPAAMNKPVNASQAGLATNNGSDHHLKAAESCTTAAGACNSAAKAIAAGDRSKAAEHGKIAQDHVTKAQDYLKQASAS